jgi:hypothetical protein
MHLFSAINDGFTGFVAYLILHFLAPNVTVTKRTPQKRFSFRSVSVGRLFAWEHVSRSMFERR